MLCALIRLQLADASVEMDQRIIEGSNMHDDPDYDTDDDEFNAAREEDASTLHYKDLTFGKEVCIHVFIHKTTKLVLCLVSN